MRRQARWTRALLSSALVGMCGIACQTVLDIQDPKMRPNATGGEGGDVTEPNGAGTSGTVTMPNGGEGGAAPVTNMSGAAGEAGAPAMKECEAGAVRCTEKTPEICDPTGHWLANTEEADGDCAALCSDGKCVECVATDSPRCAACADDNPTCNSNQPQTCVDGAWVDQDDKPCAQFCVAGVCQTAPSCNAANTDRTTCQGNVSCCESLLVPGGTFKRDFDGGEYGDASFPATISAFRLDKFEVTVGRMRQFVSAFAQLKLKSGAGKSPHIANDPGWDTDYALPPDTDALTAQLRCPGTTWSDMLTDNNDLPLNCVPYNVAYAFCIWDGGRLPTEAEWNFAAAGGDEQRAYPWRAPPTGPAITDDYANYANANPGPIAVGSKPAGDGRWGQSDLAGNVAEWALDYQGDYPSICIDCLNVTPAATRVQRGGAYNMSEDLLLGSFAGNVGPSQAFSVLGFRCARDPN